MTAAPSRPAVVVVGGGHNGLICAAYLARAGIDVVVLEARSSVGGCASTVDAVEARVNVCNCDHTMVRASGVVEDLDLAAHGLGYLDLEPSGHTIVTNGPGSAYGPTSASGAASAAGAALWSFADIERTIEALALTHPSQVDGYRRYLDAMLPVARLTLRLTEAAPRPGEVLRRLGPGALTLLRLGRSSSVAVLRRFFTDEALVAACAASGPAMWGLDPSAPGTGMGALGFALRHVTPPGRPVGGSGRLPAAVQGALEGAGGVVRTGAPVARIVCEQNRVTGVALDTGEIVPADVVVCAADPRTAIVEWVGPGAPASAAKLVERWRSRDAGDGYESKVDAVIDVPPRFIADAGDVVARLGVDPCVPTTVITPSVAGIASARRDADRGMVAPQPVMLVNIPSVADPSMAPAGGHVFSLEVLFTPYQLLGGWEHSAEPERWLEVFASHVAPGFLDGIRAWRVVTPVDYERDFGLPRGHAPSFPGGPLAALVGRDRELTRYETPVHGLFLTGAGTFPGAGVWGASGRNTAAVILSRLSRLGGGR